MSTVIEAWLLLYGSISQHGFYSWVPSLRCHITRRWKVASVLLDFMHEYCARTSSFFTRLSVGDRLHSNSAICLSDFRISCPAFRPTKSGENHLHMLMKERNFALLSRIFHCRGTYDWWYSTALCTSLPNYTIPRKLKKANLIWHISRNFRSCVRFQRDDTGHQNVNQMEQRDKLEFLIAYLAQFH